MDYKEKYKEALERAKGMWEQGMMPERIEHIFPELHESEDEKIKNEIIKFLELPHPQFVGKRHQEEWIAWLEKQGTPAKLTEEEQNMFAKGVLTSCAMSYINYLDAHRYEGKTCVSNGECKDIENAFQNAMWDKLHRYYCKYIERQGQFKESLFSQQEIDETCIEHNDSLLEKQGEQKPIDKVEPKFHEGEWIVDKSGFVQQVLDFRGGTYTCTYNSFTTDCESNYHLWTIQDAKDGDVLATKWGAFIVKEYLDIINPDGVIAYCGINTMGRFDKCDGIYPWTYEKIYPATEEQRDLLFSKMKEYGYEWNADKKELKKIEQKQVEHWQYVGTVDLEKDEEKQKEPHYTKRNALFDKCVENCDKEVMKKVSDEIDAQLQKEQKPAEWSEEFEETLNTFLFNFAHSPSEDCEPKEYIKKHVDRILKAAYKELRARLEQDIFEVKQEGIKDGIASISSAEWSKADNIGWDEAFACVTRAEKSAKNEEELQNAVTAEKWLKEIKFKYYVHPIKQEWSEEDERMRNALWNLLKIQYAQDYSMTGVGIEAGKFRDWLKFLHAQKKHEWSEEDEEMFSSTQQWLDENEQQYVEKEKTWLKSLRDRLRNKEFINN